MKRLLLVLLCVGSITPYAMAQKTPTSIYGQFVHKHQVRNYYISCNSSVRECPAVDVEDKVSIDRQSKSKVNIQIDTVGDELHVCNFVGSGHFEKGFVIARSTDPSITCKIKIKIIDDNSVGISAVSKECEYSCGAMASFYVDKLVRKQKGVEPTNPSINAGAAR